MGGQFNAELGGQFNRNIHFGVFVVDFSATNYANSH
jgi:hypothetical protein